MTHKAATPDDIVGITLSLKQELRLFLQVMETLPEVPSALVIDEAPDLFEVLEDMMNDTLNGKATVFDLCAQFKWTPNWGDLSPARHEKVKMQILEIDQLNKPEKNLSKRAQSLRQMVSIKNQVKKEIGLDEKPVLCRRKRP